MFFLRLVDKLQHNIYHSAFLDHMSAQTKTKNMCTWKTDILQTLDFSEADPLGVTFWKKGEKKNLWYFRHLVGFWRLGGEGAVDQGHNLKLF